MNRILLLLSIIAIVSCASAIPQEPAAKAAWYNNRARDLLEFRRHAQEADARAERELRETVCPSYFVFREFAQSPEIDGICAALLEPTNESAKPEPPAATLPLLPPREAVEKAEAIDLPDAAVPVEAP